MLRLRSRIIIIALAAFICCGCSTTGESIKDTTEVTATEIAPLKVGITPDYPPIIFEQAQAVKGVEADLAKRLAEELGRPLEYVKLPWDQQIPALMSGETDIIMSGMSITKAREVRINLTEPYLKSGLLAAFRIEERAKYDSIKNILNSDSTIGVVKGTTSAAFAKIHCTNADRIIELSKARDGGIELKRNVIDLFIHDAPSIIWLVSENEADLSGLWELLNVEHLAWGVVGDNPDFETAVNNSLKKFKNDGTLDKILDQWLPYRDRLK
jgi:ABC-type amino acid transport substrate-binding protein